jgi:hypothetical protein
VVEPEVTPEDVKEAVERWWWPAIVWGELGDGPKLEISITDYDQETLEVNPSEHKVIGSIVTAYAKFHNGNQSNNNVFRKHAVGASAENPISGVTSGDLYLSSSTKWNNPESEVIGFNEETGEEIHHESFVAMVRSHGMVSHYWKPGRRNAYAEAPFVRGVFISNEGDANQLLGLIEGPLHHKWMTAQESQQPKPGNFLAGFIRRKISDRVSALKNDAKPQEKDEDKPKTAGVGLTEGLYIGGAAGAGKPRTEPGATPVKRRAFSILSESRTARKIRESEVASSLTLEFEKYREDQDDQKVLLSFKWVFTEDGEKSKPLKTYPIKLVTPPGGDWEVVQPGTELSERGIYELLMEGTLGSSRITQIVETLPMDAKQARPGMIESNYKFIDDEEVEIEGGE